MHRPSWPRPTQWISSTASASSGAASSRIATATTRRPARRAPAATRKGKRPLPAIKPSGVPRRRRSRHAPRRHVAAPALQDHAARRAADELHERPDLG